VRPVKIGVQVNEFILANQLKIPLERLHDTEGYPNEKIEVQQNQVEV
jgi:hypothetical protein